MAEKILIIDDDLDTLRLVSLILQRQGYEITAASDGNQGLELAHQENPDLILLDIMMPEIDGYEVARQLRKNKLTAKTPILMFSAKNQLDDKVTGFEVGVDGYLTKPTHPTELQSHVKTLLARTGNQAEVLDPAVVETQGYVIGVLSARGGMGVSSLATNLASGLFQKTQAEVVLAELNPGQGRLALDLGLEHEKEIGLSTLLNADPENISRAKVAEQLIPNTSGFKILHALTQSRDTPQINNTVMYENLLSHLATLGRFIILDLGTGLPPSVKGLIPIINEFIVVLEGSASAIQHTRSLISNLVELGTPATHLSVVLNIRTRSEDQISWADVQKELDQTIIATLTPAPELFQQAKRMHLPAVICQPGSLTTQQLGKVADLVIEHEAQG